MGLSFGCTFALFVVRRLRFWIPGFPQRAGWGQTSGCNCHSTTHRWVMVNPNMDNPKSQTNGSPVEITWRSLMCYSACLNQNSPKLKDFHLVLVIWCLFGWTGIHQNIQCHRICCRVVHVMREPPPPQLRKEAHSNLRSFPWCCSGPCFSQCKPHQYVLGPCQTILYRWVLLNPKMDNLNSWLIQSYENHTQISHK